MNCLIVDDEPLAVDVIVSYVEQVGDMNIVETTNNPLEVIRILKQHQIDLVFLDIEMPNLNGIDLVKTLDHLPQFIFTTAYPQYALDGFNLNATDYLVKPIPFSRFLKAISRAREVYELRKSRENGREFAIVNERIQSKDYIFVKAEYENVKLEILNILFIEGLKDYLKIHLKNDGKAVLTLSNFKEIQQKLPSNFIRVHRSFLVNINAIVAYRKGKLIVGSNRISIGETYKKKVFEVLGI
ncbi:LytR/AlgR family response regulator transcription factor [Zunongwangia profunda]|jgi:DNA-binding LytR/AlgR family response regulator|uniref:LytR/AlgR family response regulator transcription factor n=2 Tax=Zunongwangia profunda TaxID=398743 RepID=UPI000C89339D|nr:response regulator transcription factor [Zunongwangia profunda]MAG87426.1 DNA-binding response regulator [Flavobacteriaceae bacterium]MCC4229542.1 response regulator transcription factor [Zunongwangia profunda]|tara:strand:- start:3369 stop:4091 length:723 start_codon:yes stop_codon:yes gene_type:complete